MTKQPRTARGTEAASSPPGSGGGGAASPRGGAEPTVVAVVPARWGSRRFPGKPLAPILGRPMIA
ncbi:MAG: cytidylyltransferase domain-containing protein, partial [bacterium]